MPIENEGIRGELVHISKPFELNHITSMFERVDPLMEDMAYALITGDQHEVDRLTRRLWPTATRPIRC